MVFRDRKDAGRQLAARLAFLKDEKDLVVLGIPRGGVVVAAEVAQALNAPLDIFIAHKLGAPFSPELAIGALASTGEIFLDDALIAVLGIPEQRIQHEIECQRIEIARRLELFRSNRPALQVEGKTVIVVDDGIATGSTMLASLRALRKQSPARLLLAIPVAPAEAVKMLERECDGVIVLETPEPFWAVGRFYRDFKQVEDSQVSKLLDALTF
ncbi:MAG: phosphoribosyltransferase [Chloroflexi bacterium]|nr:phosphoribosyltransferase [Chloroflexota bacterium]